MRITLISQLPPPRHGSTIMTENLFDSLVSQGHDVQIVERRFSQTVEAVGTFSLRKLASAAWMPVRLLKTLIFKRPDAVVFFITNRTFSFLVDALLTGVLKATRTPRILYVHTSGWRHLYQRNAVMGALARFVFRGSRSVVTLGPRLGEDLHDVAGPVPVTYIANTTSDPSAPRPAGVSNKTLRVRYISNLIPAKGVLDFVEMAESLIHEGLQIDFEIFGATADLAFQETVAARVAKVGSTRLLLGGHVPDAQCMSRLLQKTDILVFPSTYEFEAQPLTIVEAVAHGVVVAAYDVGGVADVASGGHAFLASPGAVNELSSFVRRMYHDRFELSRLSESARSFFHERLSPARFEEEWTSVLERVRQP